MAFSTKETRLLMAEQFIAGQVVKTKSKIRGFNFDFTFDFGFEVNQAFDLWMESDLRRDTACYCVETMFGVHQQRYQAKSERELLLLLAQDGVIRPTEYIPKEELAAFSNYENAGAYS